MSKNTAVYSGSVKDMFAGCHHRARVYALAFWVSGVVCVFGFGSSCFAKQAMENWLVGANDFKHLKSIEVRPSCLRSI